MESLEDKLNAKDLEQMDEKKPSKKALKREMKKQRYLENKEAWKKEERVAYL
jgi:hypothetical protein